MGQVKLKSLYADMIQLALIEDDWQEQAVYQASGQSFPCFFRDYKWVGHYRYALMYYPAGFFRKRVTVLVESADGTKGAHDFLYSVLSPVFWRIRRCEKDKHYLKVQHNENLLGETIRAYARASQQKKIEEYEETQVRLERIENERQEAILRAQHVTKPITQKWEISLQEAFRVQLNQRMNQSKRKDEDS